MEEKKIKISNSGLRSFLNLDWLWFHAKGQSYWLGLASDIGDHKMLIKNCPRLAYLIFDI